MIPAIRVRILSMLRSLLFLITGILAHGETLRIPAATAYLDPDPNGARVRDDGISHWKNSDLSINWFGHLTTTGGLNPQIEFLLPEGTTLPLTLKVGDQTRETTVTGNASGAITANFGNIPIESTGYHQFSLTSPKPAGEIKTLLLAGTATQGAHFNLKPRRNAASVHLAYPVEPGEEIDAFYCEMTAVEDPLWTYYMATGWHRGYFGMQVNSPTERRIIFSVWDSGGEAVDRNKVGSEDRVTLIAKGENVNSGSFGNEGTGGHSHLKFQWKTGERQRFLVTAEPTDATHTIFSGYYFRPDLNEWFLISSWKAPKEGNYLRGLYSFSENFAGQNGHVLRRADYGNQWTRTTDGKWHEVTRATFSHDSTGKADRLDRFMGVTPTGDFFLSQGGFIDGSTKFGTPFTRPISKRSPDSFPLPPLPKIKK
ncbi:MAG: DUF3472 domain-containing protein [Verrucomicrobiaceae bacterium]